MAVTAKQLFEQLVKAGLSSAEHIQASCESAGLELETATGESLAKRLIKDGRLTLFQAQIAVNGKAGSLVLGNYVLFEKLGQGGMGQVYKARHRTMKRDVALKVISSDVVKDENSLRRFQREVEAVSRLNHPNIVTAHDAGEFKGTHYLVMECIRGSDLSSVVKKSGPMPVVKAVECVMQAARGLAYAHSNGIVHRDIKPANLLLDESGTIKILDMGLARFEESGQDHASVAALTGTGMLMGTIDYMSPEQAMDSKTADARSDIYSLGCTLYFLLTGRAVYEEDTIVKRLMAHQGAMIPKLSVGDGRLQPIFERCIAKKPSDRYATMDQLVQDLQQWLSQAESAGFRTTAEMSVAQGSLDVSNVELKELDGRDDVGLSGGPSSKLKSVTPSASSGQSGSPLKPATEKSSDTAQSTAGTAQTVSPGGAPKPGRPAEKSPTLAGAGTTRAVTPDADTKPRPAGNRTAGVRSASEGRTSESSSSPPAGESTASGASGKLSRSRTMRVQDRRLARSNGGSKPWLLYGGVGGLAILALLAVIVLRVKTPFGTIIIETSQPEIAGAVINVDEQQAVTLETGEGEEPIKVQADEQEHTLKVTKRGFQTFTHKFTVKAGDSQTITVRLEFLQPSQDSPAPMDASRNKAPKIAKQESGNGPTADEAPLTAIDVTANATIPITVTTPVAPEMPVAAPAAVAAAATTPEPAGDWLIPQLAQPSEVSASPPKQLPFDPGPFQKWKTGAPISPKALVGNPTTIKELASWSVEPISHLIYPGSVAVSPDGELMATAGYNDATVRIWRMPEGGPESSATLVKVLLGESGGVWDAEWSPSGSLLATSNEGQRQISIYNALTGRRLRTIDLPNGGAQMIEWSPDGSQILLPSWRLQILDVAANTLRSADKASNFHRATWSPSGREIVTLEEHGNVTFWDSSTLQIIAETLMPDFTRDTGLDWSPDGKWIAIGGKSGRVTLWDATTHRMRKDKVTNAAKNWAHFAWEPSPLAGGNKHPRWPRLLMTSSGVSEIWDAELNERLAICPSAGVNEFSSDWTPDGTRVVTVNTTFAIPQVFDAKSGEMVSTAKAIVPTFRGTFSVSADGKTLRALYENELLIFNAETGEYLRKLANIVGNQMSTSPNDDWIAVYNRDVDDQPLVLIDTATYEKRVPLSGHTGKVTAVNWSIDNQYLASCDSTGLIRIWKALDQTLMREIGSQRPVKCVAWSPDGKQLASCGDDEIIRLWDVTSGEQSAQYEALASPAATGSAGIAWCPTSGFIAVAQRSAQAIVLDLKTGKFSDPVISLNSGLTRVVWSPDGKQLLAGNGGEIGYRAIRSKSATTAAGHGDPFQWLPDNRRLVTGQNMAAAIQAVDTRRSTRLGALLPRMPDGGWLCIGAEGHYRGSEGIEAQIVYVALHKDGSQTTHAPAEFATRYGWKNDPSKAAFLKLRDGRDNED